MKTTSKAWTEGLTFFLMHPVLAQDTASALPFCCEQSEAATLNQKIEIDPLQWVTTGDEAELLDGMTKVVQEKIRFELKRSSMSNSGNVSSAERSQESAPSK